MSEVRGGTGDAALDTKKFNGVLQENVTSAAVKKEVSLLFAIRAIFIYF